MIGESVHAFISNYDDTNGNLKYAFYYYEVARGQ